MQAILSLRCLYDTARQSWAIELTLDGGAGTHRFPISPDQAEAFLEAFDDCSKAEFDPSSQEVVFTYEYEDDEEEENEEEEESVKGKSRKGQGRAAAAKKPSSAGKRRS